MKAAAEGVRRTKSVTLHTVFLRMTFDRAGFNISGRSHPWPTLAPASFFRCGNGPVALGLVVGNVGALCQLRYPFWAVLIVLGAGGAEAVRCRKSCAASLGGGFDPEQASETFHS